MTDHSTRQLAWAGVAIVVAALGLADFATTHGWITSLEAMNVPVMPLLLLVALVILPLLLSLALPAASGYDRSLHALNALVHQSRARLFALLALAALATLSGLVVLGGMLALPADGARTAIFDLAHPAQLAAGRAMLIGAGPAAVELRYRRDRLGISPDVRFLPVDDGHHHSPTTLVVQLPDDGLTFDPHNLPTTGFAGVLVADGLPAPAAASLRQNGELVAGHYWTLYTNPVELFRPYWLNAAARLLAALLLLALAGLEWRKWRGLEMSAGIRHRTMLQAG
jgi:hypothetical protein